MFSQVQRHANLQLAQATCALVCSWEPIQEDRRETVVSAVPLVEVPFDPPWRATPSIAAAANSPARHTGSWRQFRPVLHKASFSLGTLPPPEARGWPIRITSRPFRLRRRRRLSSSWPNGPPMAPSRRGLSPWTQSIACSRLLALRPPGARVFTATSRQGLLYGFEMLYTIAGWCVPLVLVNVSRGLSLPITLEADHNDILLHGTWTSAVAANGWDWGPWSMHMIWGSWGMGMMLVMALRWAAIVVAMVFCIRWLITAGARRHQAVAGHVVESALDILQKRYARGEISKAEFQDMRQELQERD